MTKSLVDWRDLADKTCEVISFCHQNRKQLDRAAYDRQITFDSLMAAAIVQMIREQVGQSLDES